MRGDEDGDHEGVGGVGEGEGERVLATEVACEAYKHRERGADPHREGLPCETHVEAVEALPVVGYATKAAALLMGGVFKGNSRGKTQCTSGIGCERVRCTRVRPLEEPSELLAEKLVRRFGFCNLAEDGLLSGSEVFLLLMAALRSGIH